MLKCFRAVRRRGDLREIHGRKGQNKMLVCDNCYKTIQKRKDGKKSGVSFETQEGELLTICRECLEGLVIMSDEERDAFFAEFGIERR